MDKGLLGSIVTSCFGDKFAFLIGQVVVGTARRFVRSEMMKALLLLSLLMGICLAKPVEKFHKKHWKGD